MASSKLSPAYPAAKPNVAEAPAEKDPAAEQLAQGFWAALRWRAHKIFLNYMGLQAQMGLYPTSDEYGDP